MASDYQRLLKEVAELRRKLANMVRVGTVDQVKGDKLRMNMGKGEGEGGDSGDVLGPWVNHTNHRGEHRERQAFRKGQNVTMICPDGDPRQAFIVPYAPNKEHKPPKHAGESGVGEHTYQNGGFYKSRGNDGDDNWIGKDEGPGADAGEERENSGGLAMGGGGGSQGGQQGQQGGKQQQKRKTAGSDDESTYVRRMNKEGGHTLRYKKDVRAAVHEKGAKTKAGDDTFSAVHADGKLHQKAKEEYVGQAKKYYVNSDEPRVKVPWKLGTKDAKDSIPDDNE